VEWGPPYSRPEKSVDGWYTCKGRLDYELCPTLPGLPGLDPSVPMPGEEEAQEAAAAVPSKRRR
jgi:hypothetical protein